MPTKSTAMSGVGRDREGRIVHRVRAPATPKRSHAPRLLQNLTVAAAVASALAAIASAQDGACALYEYYDASKGKCSDLKDVGKKCDWDLTCVTGYCDPVEGRCLREPSDGPPRDEGCDVEGAVCVRVDSYSDGGLGLCSLVVIGVDSDGEADENGKGKSPKGSNMNSVRGKKGKGEDNELKLFSLGASDGYKVSKKFPSEGKGKGKKCPIKEAKSKKSGKGGTVAQPVPAYFQANVDVAVVTIARRIKEIKLVGTTQLFDANVYLGGEWIKTLTERDIVGTGEGDIVEMSVVIRPRYEGGGGASGGDDCNFTPNATYDWKVDQGLVFTCTPINSTTYIDVTPVDPTGNKPLIFPQGSIDIQGDVQMQDMDVQFNSGDFSSDFQVSGDFNVSGTLYLQDCVIRNGNYVGTNLRGVFGQGVHKRCNTKEYMSSYDQLSHRIMNYSPGPSSCTGTVFLSLTTDGNEFTVSDRTPDKLKIEADFSTGSQNSIHVEVDDYTPSTTSPHEWSFGKGTSSLISTVTIEAQEEVCIRSVSLLLSNTTQYNTAMSIDMSSFTGCSTSMTYNTTNSCANMSEFATLSLNLTKDGCDRASFF